MSAHLSGPDVLSPQTQAFYRHALVTLREQGVPFILGGAYTFGHYTGIIRHTKDLDVFVRPADQERALKALAEAGYRTELTYPHWLGKAFAGDDFVDVIHSSSNGIAVVDEAWFEHSEEGELLGETAQLSPVEEMIWSKGFTMERNRYDGADIAHLLLARANRLSWPRLLSRFEGFGHVLLSHLVLFSFVYPGEQQRIPSQVFEQLWRQVQEGRTAPSSTPLCRGTLLAATQYQADILERGYQDARLPPWGSLTGEQAAHWDRMILQGH